MSGDMSMDTNKDGSVPEVGDNLIARVGLLLVLLGRTLGDLELFAIVDAVGAVGRAGDLTAVEAMAENLRLGSVCIAVSQLTGERTLAAESPTAS
jgi:hypothetical protein